MNLLIKKLKSFQLQRLTDQRFISLRFFSKRVAVGLSGGLDSAVSAYLLKEQGYDLVGVFIKAWKDTEDRKCTYHRDKLHAIEVCKTLDIPFHEVDFTKQYWEKVLKPLIYAYKDHLLSPLPSTLTNSEIKFQIFKKYVKEELGINTIATGDYAALEEINGVLKLIIAEDDMNDQTYFISTTKGENFRNVIFPLGNYQKSEVIDIFEKSPLNHIPVRERKQSLFLNTKLRGAGAIEYFLKDHIQFSYGRMVDLETWEIYPIPHKGLELTLCNGRANIGGAKAICLVAFRGKVPSIPPIKCGHLPMNVDFLKKSNNVYIVEGTDHPALFTHSLTLDGFNWISGVPEGIKKTLKLKSRSVVDRIIKDRYRNQEEETWEDYHLTAEIEGLFLCQCKSRYGPDLDYCYVELLHSGAEVEVNNNVEIEENKGVELKVLFASPMRIVNRGLPLVLYDDGICLGGAVLPPPND